MYGPSPRLTYSYQHTLTAPMTTKLIIQLGEKICLKSLISGEYVYMNNFLFANITDTRTVSKRSFRTSFTLSGIAMLSPNALALSNARRNSSQIGWERACQLFSRAFLARFSRPTSSSTVHRWNDQCFVLSIE